MKSIVRQPIVARLRPKRGRAQVAAATLIACCVAYDCGAVDRVILEVRQLSTASVQASDATITLDVSTGPESTSPTLRSQIRQLRLLERGPVYQVLGTTYSDIDITCTDLLVRKPQFACNQGSISARGASGPIAMSAAAAYDASSGAASVSGSGLKVAGATTRFIWKFQSGLWSLDADGTGLDLASARKVAQPWLALPPGDSVAGHLQFQAQAAGRFDRGNPAGQLQAHLTASTSDLNYSNQPGTAVAQDVAASVTASISRDLSLASNEGHTRSEAADRPGGGDLGRFSSDVQLRSSSGQVLVGVVLLDFAKNPLNLQAHVEPSDGGLAVSQIRLNQTDLIDAQGDAQVALSGPARVPRAHFDVYRLECAAAYRSFLQLTLATTDFGRLNVGGRAGGALDIVNDSLSKVTAYVQNVSMADSTARLSLANANGQVHWAAAPGATVPPSQLSWSGSSAYGLIGGPVQMGFTARGTDFTLEKNTRFPIFNGALVVHTLAIRRFGAPDAELDFDAHLEPISMPLLSKAFGWPVLSGQLAGTIPGVTYRDHVLAMQGDLVANVFDGIIIGNRLRLTDPWGRWPQLDANVTARNLDLDLLTHTFPIGSISGRLDADIRGLELFDWSPVAFDARLQTTPGDRSRHLISQRAVTSISSVGGGGGGVAAALQSGVMKFFDTFHYDRIGISCRLRGEICLMSGIEPARPGYYLVKGRGLPRIDIIGNAGRVDWPQLVGQIASSIHSQNIVVR